MSSDYLRDAIQRLLDESGDGWTVSQFVVVMGLVRIDSDGQIESVPWFWSPKDQPDWLTLGLLERATGELHYAEFEEDD
jgi:hypothetical protein